jgi:hypothetical protein
MRGMVELWSARSEAQGRHPDMPGAIEAVERASLRDEA